MLWFGYDFLPQPFLVPATLSACVSLHLPRPGPKTLHFPNLEHPTPQSVFKKQSPHSLILFSSLNS